MRLRTRGPQTAGPGRPRRRRFLVAVAALLLAAFSRGERADLSQKERTTLAALTKRIVAEYRARIVKESA